MQVRNGAGILEVRGSKLASGLFLHGKPFVLNWYACDGSVGQQVLHDAEVSEEAIAHFRGITTQGIAGSIPLAQQFTALLQQCKSSRYTLTLEELGAQFLWSEWWADAGDASGYYPDDPALVFTQTMESLSDDCILDYMLQIEAGARPIVVTLTANEARCEFILDGHHKLMAYAHLRVSPTRLRITDLDTRRLTLADYPQRPLLKGFEKALAWEGQHR